MADFEGLLARYRGIIPSIMDVAKSGKRILVSTHIDADGLCSGSAVFEALTRKGANVVLRTLRQKRMLRLAGFRVVEFGARHQRLEDVSQHLGIGARRQSPFLRPAQLCG